MEIQSRAKFYSQFFLRVLRITLINAALAALVLFFLSKYINFPFNRMNFGITLWWVSMPYFLPLIGGFGLSGVESNQISAPDPSNVAQYSSDVAEHQSINMKCMFYGGVSLLLSVNFMFL